MRWEAQLCLSCLWRWVRVVGSYTHVVISRTLSHGAHILVLGTWETVLKVTYNRGGVGARLCPHPWGVTSAAHPSPQPGALALLSVPGPACRPVGALVCGKCLTLPQFTLQGSEPLRLAQQVPPSAWRDSWPFPAAGWVTQSGVLGPGLPPARTRGVLS